MHTAGKGRVTAVNLIYLLAHNQKVTVATIGNGGDEVGSA